MTEIDNYETSNTFDKVPIWLLNLHWEDMRYDVFGWFRWRGGTACVLCNQHAKLKGNFIELKDQRWYAGKMFGYLETTRK